MLLNRDDVSNIAARCNAKKLCRATAPERFPFAQLALCHYPFRSWSRQDRRSINLHGHSYGNLKPMPRRFDVGVDARSIRFTTLATPLGADPPDDVRTPCAGPSATLRDATP